jgi:hypothetical protein
MWWYSLLALAFVGCAGHIPTLEDKRENCKTEITAECTPVINKDIFFKIDKSNIAIGGSKAELAVTLISIAGIPIEKNNIRVTGLIEVKNVWWDDINIQSIKYEMNQDNNKVGFGNAEIKKPILLKSKEKIMIPMHFDLITKDMSTYRALKQLTNNSEMIINSEVQVGFHGKIKTYTFENGVK